MEINLDQFAGLRTRSHTMDIEVLGNTFKFTLFVQDPSPYYSFQDFVHFHGVMLLMKHHAPNVRTFQNVTDSEAPHVINALMHY